MNKVMLTNLSDSFSKFINELELSFDYIKKEDIEKLKSLTTLESFEENPDNIKNLNVALEKFNEQICKIQFSKTKLSTKDYKFLKNIVLFDFFSFELFLPENKNTKKSLVNYLYTWTILSSATEENEDTLQLIESIQKQLAISEEESENVASSSNSKKTKKKIEQLSKNLRQDPSAMSQVNKLMTDLMSNQEIMSIANDVSKQFQENKIDPTKIMSSLLSGDLNNPELKSIFENVSTTIEQKINDGSIDKGALEDQTNDIMSKIANSNLANILGGIKK